MNPYFQGVNQRSFGTYPMRGEQCRAAIAAAIDTGYRAIDTARIERLTHINCRIVSSDLVPWAPEWD
ncbi:MAG: hypothetical protein GY789_00050 [Hyphomicrobiales bacterium]|nr:hypothetical protein [Hyphomicrobiales bacterium]